MPLQLITPAAEEPVSLAEAKRHLRVESADDDALIGSLISAARQSAETLTGRQFVTARWKLVLDSFPGPSLMGVPAGLPFSLPGHAILLPKCPVQCSIPWHASADSYASSISNSACAVPSPSSEAPAPPPGSTQHAFACSSPSHSCFNLSDLTQASPKHPLKRGVAASGKARLAIVPKPKRSLSTSS
jgi:hypothetical protein